jgi:prepilin-type N-terminal cleavage/methylation domain-containing protein
MPQLHVRTSERAHAREGGFTLVEIMVAIMVLLIGVLGSVALVDAANRTSSTTRAREAATNLARSVLEAARSLPYASLTQATAPAGIQADPGLADSDAGTAGWQVSRRNITFTIAMSVCAVDDPADGIGKDDSTFCSVGTPTNPADPRPADYKRASVTVSWKDASGPRTQTESGVISGTYRGPSVTSIKRNPDTTDVFTDTSNPGKLQFDVIASSGTDHVNWSLDGNDQGAIVGCGTSCSLSWNLGKPTGSPPCDPSGNGVLDGTYIVGANAFDSTGLSDNSAALTVQINRCPPMAPTGFQGGMTIVKPSDPEKASFPGTELQWDQSPEEDVIGYHVYKSASATGPWTQVQPGQNPDPSQPGCDGLVKTPNCVDADTVTKVYYIVTAVDRDPNGNPREGQPTAPLLVDPGNSEPSKPGGLGIDASTPWTIKWSGSKFNANSPPSDYTDFYYIYRDGMSGRSDRYDSIDSDGSGSTMTWTDPDPGVVAHDYWLVAVDNHLAESNPAPDYPNKHRIHCDTNGACVIQ